MGLSTYLHNMYVFSPGDRYVPGHRTILSTFRSDNYDENVVRLKCLLSEGCYSIEEVDSSDRGSRVYYNDELNYADVYPGRLFHAFCYLSDETEFLSKPYEPSGYELLKEINAEELDAADFIFTGISPLTLCREKTRNFPPYVFKRKNLLRLLESGGIREGCIEEWKKMCDKFIDGRHIIFNYF